MKELYYCNTTYLALLKTEKQELRKILFRMLNRGNMTSHEQPPNFLPLPSLHQPLVLKTNWPKEKMKQLTAAMSRTIVQQFWKTFGHSTSMSVYRVMNIIYKGYKANQKKGSTEAELQTQIQLRDKLISINILYRCHDHKQLTMGHYQILNSMWTGIQTMNVSSIQIITLQSHHEWCTHPWTVIQDPHWQLDCTMSTPAFFGSSECFSSCLWDQTRSVYRIRGNASHALSTGSFQSRSYLCYTILRMQPLSYSK